MIRDCEREYMRHIVTRGERAGNMGDGMTEIEKMAHREAFVIEKMVWKERKAKQKQTQEPEAKAVEALVYGACFYSGLGLRQPNDGYYDSRERTPEAQ